MDKTELNKELIQQIRDSERQRQLSSMVSRMDKRQIRRLVERKQNKGPQQTPIALIEATIEARNINK